MYKILIIILLWSCNNGNSGTVTTVPLNFHDSLAHMGHQLSKDKVTYNASYVKLTYPNGDVPPNLGACTDVIIRAYRKMSIDLQKEVHEDMIQVFHLYPNRWGLSKPDYNIDHRRVYNLMVFFERKGEILPITNNPKDFRPGDIICWELSRGMTHIGLITNEKVNNTYYIIHNIGGGQVLENCLFNYKIIGHYRYKK